MANVGQFFHPKTKSFVEAALGLFLVTKWQKICTQKIFAATKWSSALLFLILDMEIDIPTQHRWLHNLIRQQLQQTQERGSSYVS